MIPSMRSPWILMAAVLTAVFVQKALAQKAPAASSKDNPSDWPMYTRDLAGTRFSPLTQINTANVANLTQAWIFHLRDTNASARGGESAQEREAKGASQEKRVPTDTPSQEGVSGGGASAAAAAAAASGSNPEATPIVVNGVMYLPAGNRILARTRKAARNSGKPDCPSIQ
jgi:hypothetical protein